MQKKLNILLLFLSPIIAFSQKENSDSLKYILRTVTTDSARFTTCYKLAFYYLEANRDSGLYFSDKCLALAEKNNHPLDVAVALDSKGYILMHLGKGGESLKCFLKAIKIAEDPANENTTWWLYDKIFTPHKKRIEILLNIHHDLGHLMGMTDTDQQIFHYRETGRLAEEIGDTMMLGFVNMNLGSAYLKLGKIDSALQMEKTAASIFQQQRDERYLSHVFSLIGNIFLKKGDNQQALQNFSSGVQSAIEQHNFSTLSDIYTTLSAYYINDKNKDSSLYYASKNLVLLQSMQSKDLGDAYFNLYKSYVLNNNNDSAYLYQGLALNLLDSTYKAKIKNLSEFQQLSFKEKQRLQQLEQERVESKNKIRNYGLLAALSIFLLIGIFLLRNNRQKQKANKVLELTLSDLKTTQTQLIQSEKMASLGELTAGIAHEIQNPLNFVNNFSEVSNELIDEMKDELKKGNYQGAEEIASDVKQNLEKINHHGKRADAIVKGMLQHSRSRSGQKELTNINALADEYLRLAYHGLRAKDKSFNTTMKTDFDESIGNINIIPQDIGRVILNLITNAFYAVDEKKKSDITGYEPTVSVSTKKIDVRSDEKVGWDTMEISVSDNGNGIPKHIIDKIFQPFFTTKPTGQGTGLGLSLSYDIVKAHGGEFKVETKENAGTTFIIHLPMN